VVERYIPAEHELNNKPNIKCKLLCAHFIEDKDFVVSYLMFKSVTNLILFVLNKTNNGNINTLTSKLRHI
jgi:hypothetical protein